MEIKLIDVKRDYFRKPCYGPETVIDEWPVEVNARLILDASRDRATLIYQGEKFTSNGWVASNYLSRYGWNFYASKDLVDQEDWKLVCNHLVNDHFGSTAFLLQITPGDEKSLTMLELAKEIVIAIEIQL